ncbi:MAG: PAS domain-containing protein, partial [Coleofasciculus sp. S288]|nr:PAS domain-containing protein [Coleofasciculus sp. S288]
VLGENGQLLEWLYTYTLKGQLEHPFAEAWRNRTEVRTVLEKSSNHLVALTSRSVNLQDREQATGNTGNSAPQHHRHQMIRELSQAIVWEAEAKTLQFTFVSPSAERLLGYPADEWLSDPEFWVKLIHPQDRLWAVSLCRKKMFQSRDYELEYRCITADNRVVWLRDRACVVRNERGKVGKRRGLMVDITLAKQAEAELQIRLRQQATVAQLGQTALLGTDISTLMNDSVFLVAETLAVEYCKILELLPNGNALRLRAGVGWQAELVGHAIIEASDNTQAGYTLHTRQPVIVEDLSREARFRGSPLLHDHNIVSGLSVVIESASKKKRLNSDEANVPHRPFGVLGVHTSRRKAFSQGDIDFLQAVANILSAAIECQRAYEALDESTARLYQITQVLGKRNLELEQFAYVASHDLKAPLRAIANLSQWIEEDIADQLNEENRQQMQLMRGRVHRLEALIEGLLQYSRAGRFNVKPESVDVAVLLRQIIDKLKRPDPFTIDIAPGMPTLVTDRLRLEQIFNHLLDNAIKHHPRSNGTVRISVRELSDAYEFAVADDGAGIAPQFQERIFLMFQTLQARDTLESTGVGLAIAKKIVESQGGIIRLESQEGQGATFYFTWPKQ